MGNPLTDILTPEMRKYFYAAFFLAGVITSALAIFGVDVGKTPDVLTYLGTALSLVAASNVQTGGGGIPPE